MKRTISAFIISGLIILTGCEKNELRLIDTSSTEGKAFLKINYAMPHLQTATTSALVQLKVNGERIGYVPSATNYSYPFPGGGLNTQGGSQPDYFALTPGTANISVSKPNNGTNVDSIVLFTGAVNISAGKNYTAHLADTGTNASVVLVEDNVSEPDSGTSRFVFVNLLPNQAALDLYHGTVKVASAIPYKGASPEIILDAQIAGKWIVRLAGSTTASPIVAQYPTTTALFTVPDRRVLTVFARGYTGVTGLRAPAISLVYNR